jgi:ABC-2 type transport system permease protein
MSPDKPGLPGGVASPPVAIWAILPDALFAIASFVVAYRLRFAAEQFDVFIASALRSLPLVVLCQMAALVLARVYRPGGRYRFVLRLPLAVGVGTGAAAALTRALFGFEGVSRMAFLVDATFLTAAAMAWRGLYVLWKSDQSSHTRLTEDSPLVDRSLETMSLSATFLSIVHYRELLKNLVLKDLKLKYRGSVFGFLWSLVNPLVMIVVYTVAFTYIMRTRTEGFAFFVLIGTLAWTFFSSSTTMSASSIVDNGRLIKSLHFPRAVLPTATVIFNLAQYILTTVVFLPFMLSVYQVPLEPRMLLFPLFLALQVVFTIGLALMLSTATAFFRDVRHLIDVAMLALFWTTPILYSIETVPESIRLPVLMSPMSPYIVAYQQIFYFRHAPEPTIWFLSTTYAMVSVIAGAATFVAVQDQLGEQV